MKPRRIAAGLSLLLCTVLSFTPALQQIVLFPEVIQQTTYQQPPIPKLAPLITLVQTDSRDSGDQRVVPASQFRDVHVAYKLFGLFPLKNSEIQVMPALELLPGGQSIGVSIQAKGVMVVGQAPIKDLEGKTHLPGKEAGIEIGDVILKVEDKEVATDQDVANAIHQAGEKRGIVDVLIKHRDQIVEKQVRPYFCRETGRYRIGLFVRDEAAGVGTLTFVDPVTKKYGALGHVINDADTNQKIEVSNGKVIASSIQSIEKGRKGHPGEKIGSFAANSGFCGTIEKNTAAGIFGVLNGEITNPYFQAPIPVGWTSEIKEGPAKIYTVVDGEKVEEFEVNIERIMPHRTDSKNMVIKVTDPRLIEMTGGIIQGMSGSPIVQNGKLVGAVTHVFVNDSLRGYGVFIQNMLKEANMLAQKEAA